MSSSTVSRCVVFLTFPDHLDVVESIRQLQLTLTLPPMQPEMARNLDQLSMFGSWKALTRKRMEAGKEMKVVFLSACFPMSPYQ